MARPKKDYVLFNMRADASVMKRFNAYCEEVGQTKTHVFEMIVSEFLDQVDRRAQKGESTKQKAGET